VPFRYRCATIGCDFDHFSPGVATAHESLDGHNCEVYNPQEADESDTDYALDLSDIGVPRGQGESWHEAAERLRGDRDRVLPAAREAFE